MNNMTCVLQRKCPLAISKWSKWRKVKTWTTLSTFFWIGTSKKRKKSRFLDLKKRILELCCKLQLNMPLHCAARQQLCRHLEKWGWRSHDHILAITGQQLTTTYDTSGDHPPITSSAKLCMCLHRLFRKNASLQQQYILMQ